ncbi:YrzI family small protein [Salipaludibacillus aurantiacus]|uniref:Probable sporulation protein (Bac_small_yrzI) n=1 Tax=Salipaludibacillus aurantiacus TaxID=1601833 RepID=A0A1H9VYL0_9BACI|nr:YrzI family small protein [Salipaludibacillus aurantiacus]SES26745.1 Probable sporulation protein (Bac_small_yrzI) [Salipaludibacillus aurantiacus]
MKLNILFFTITIVKRPEEDRIREELHLQRIQRRLDEAKTKYMNY